MLETEANGRVTPTLRASRSSGENSTPLMGQEEEQYRNSIDDDTHPLVGDPTITAPSGSPEALVSMPKMLALTCFSFSFGLLLGTYAMVTLPIESSQLVENAEDKVVAFAFLLGLAGSAQLACPAAGFFSDRARSRYGKRRPFMVAGSIVGVAGLLAQWMFSGNNFVGYSISFLISNLALNVISTSAYGLIPDMIPESQAGKANGLSTLWGVLGNCTGFLYYFTVSEISGMYWLYMASVIATTTVTWYAADEQSTSLKPYSGMRENLQMGCHSFQWSELTRSYWVSPSEHRDFFLVLIGRTCFYIGVSVNAFLQFYFEDVIALPDQGALADAGRATCVMAFVGQGAGILSAFPSGAISDNYGRKPLIVLGTLGIGIGYLGLGVVSTPMETFAIGAFVGFANGIYQAVDLALALDVIPSKADSARFLGVWGVGSFVGACVGPAIGAPLLSSFGHITQEERDAGDVRTYGHAGYVALMVYGVSVLCLGTVILMFVKGAK